MTGVHATFYEYEKKNIAHTTIIPKVVDDFRNKSHTSVGQVKQVLGNPKPEDMEPVGIKTSKADDWGTKECITGTYSVDEQQPDPTIGKSKHYNSIPQDVCMLILYCRL